MGNVSNLNIERSNAAGDSKLASVSDRLEEALKDSRGGEFTKCLIVLYHEEDDRFYIDTRYAGCTKLEARGLLLTEIEKELKA